MLIEDFVEIFKKNRKDRGWTLNMAASKLNCTKGNLSKMEQGKLCPRFKMIRRLEDFMSYYWNVEVRVVENNVRKYENDK